MPPPPPRRGRLTGRISAKTAVAFAYVAGLLIAALDAHIINVMLPTIGHVFDSPLGTVQWAVIIYVLALAIAMPASGWFAGHLGDRRVFIGAILAFAVASVLCGLAQDLPQLIVMRFFQGAAAGLFMPVGTALLYRVYRPDERARLTRVLLLPIAAGPAIAPPLGGLFVDALSWRFAFFLNVPVCLTTVVFLRLGLTGDSPATRRRFDAVGFFLAATGLSLLLFVLGQGESLGWKDPLVVIGTVVSVLALTTFVTRSLRVREPLLEIRLFQERLFRRTSVAFAFSTCAWLGGLLYLLPLFLEQRAHVSPLRSGLVIGLNAVGVIISSQSIGRLYEHIGPRRLIAVGQGIVAAVLVTIAVLPEEGALATYSLLTFMAGAGFGLALVGLQTSMFANIRPDETNSAATLLNVNRQVCTALGVATATTVLTAYTSDDALPFRIPFLVAALFAFSSAVSAIFIDDRDAAATMPSQRARGPSGPLPTTDKVGVDEDSQPAA